MTTDILKKIQNISTAKAGQLNLKGCDIEELPNEIGALENLVTLDLRCNRIKKLPDSMSNLRKLKKLHLSENVLEEFPEVILSMENLQHICLSANNISTIPDDINRLKNLTELLMSNNKIKKLPDSILDLTNLRHLCLQNNELEFLPKNIDQLKNLNELHLQHNKLTHLNFKLENAAYLQNISLQANPLVDPPMSIILKGQGAILSYLLEKERGRIFKIPIDSNFKTALKQYLVFFNDFVLASKGVSVNFEATTYDEGIELNIKTNSDEELIEIKQHLDEYISFTRTNIDNLKPEFKVNINERQKDILIVDLKNQIRFLQSSLELRSLESKILAQESDKFYNLLLLEKKLHPSLIIQNEITSISQSNNSNNFKIEIKAELPNLQNEIYELKKILYDNPDKAVLVELENIDVQILEMEDCQPDVAKIDKTPFKKLKRILDDINNEESTLGKTVKATGKAVEAAKQLGRTYNKFAQWLALPQVPDIFVQ